jgi:hypothetical protein
MFYIDSNGLRVKEVGDLGVQNCQPSTKIDTKQIV